MPEAYYRIADLDNTDDAADWLTPGYVLDEYDVDWIRNLKILK